MAKKIFVLAAVLIFAVNGTFLFLNAGSTVFQPAQVAIASYSGTSITPTADAGPAPSPDAASHDAAAPDDSFYKSKQRKSFETMSVPESWAITGGSEKIIVAVLDTGVDGKHPDLVGRVLTNGYNFVDDNKDTSDNNGHGTMVAGIIAANVGNSIGIAGATKNCMVLPVKVLDAKGNGYVGSIAAGITYAVEQGANVINLSLGCSEFSSVLQDAVNDAYSKGVIVIAASGNSGGPIQYPAACTHAVAVGSVSSSNSIAAYSNHGNSLALVAVGSSIFSTLYSDGSAGYGLSSGTSYATPFVSSLAALLLSLNSAYSPAQLTKIMEDTAVDLGDPGWDGYFGYGCINFESALKYAKSDKSGITAEAMNRLDTAECAPTDNALVS